VAAAVLVAGLCAAQLPFRVYHSLEPYDRVPLPNDYEQRHELVLARLMYPSSPYARFDRWGADWKQGGTSWSVDYPRGDRHFVAALRRLTRVDVRSVEQPVNPDDGDDIYNWPFLYVNLPGNWDLTPAQTDRLRDYLQRGGFLMADNFWGVDEWEGFEAGIGRILPGQSIVELDDDSSILHTAFDLKDRYQIPGQWAIRRGATSRNGGTTPHWQGIHDAKGRIMVVISFNSDVGDSWEFADDPLYPEHYSALGFRMGVNYVVYALSH
jgi:hypothetical protein